MRCTMTFFDTNILVYATIDQGKDKLDLSEKTIEDAINNGSFFISPLVLSEYIFILSKLKIVEKHHADIIFFSKFVYGVVDSRVTTDAYTLCRNISFCKNINDAMHLKVAEAHCTKLVTFDSDFKNLQKYTKLEIEVLQV